MPSRTCARVPYVISEDECKHLAWMHQRIEKCMSSFLMADNRATGKGELVYIMASHVKRMWSVVTHTLKIITQRIVLPWASRVFSLEVSYDASKGSH